MAIYKVKSEQLGLGIDEPFIICADNEEDAKRSCCEMMWGLPSFYDAVLVENDMKPKFEIKNHCELYVKIGDKEHYVTNLCEQSMIQMKE